MRILVVGTVPPPGGPAEHALARLAAHLVDEGHEVEILSPDPRSAAHHHGRTDGYHVLVRILAASRRCEGLVLRVQPASPVPQAAGRIQRALLLVVLGLLVARFRQVTIRLDSPIPIPGGLGGRAIAGLWAKAETILVGSEEDRDRMLAVPGVRPERVVLAEIPPLPTRQSVDGWSLGEGADPRAEILVHVRRRAAATRKLLRAGEQLPAIGETKPGNGAVTELEEGRSPLLPDGTVKVDTATVLRFAIGNARQIRGRVRGRVRRLLR